MTQVFSNEIRKVILDDITERFNPNFDEYREELESFQRKYKQQLKSDFNKWKLTKDTLTDTFVFLDFSHKSLLLDQLKGLRKTLEQYAIAENTIILDQSSFRYELRGICSGIHDFLDFDLKPDPEEIYNHLLESGPLEVTLPVVGKTQMSLHEFERRLRGKPIMDFIREEIEAMNYAEYSNRINELYSSCENFFKKIDENDNLHAAIKIEYESEFLAQVGELINNLGTLGLSSNTILDNLINTINSTFGLQINIEVATPETTMDETLAQILTYCDPMNINRQELLQIGQHLGLGRLDHLSNDELCELLQNQIML